MTHDAAAHILTIDIERNGAEVLVRCHGKLVAEVSGNFHARICRLIPESKKIVLDLTDLTQMDSMGLGAVVRLYVSAKSSGCCLELINLGKRIRELLGMTNLLSVLTSMCDQGISVRF